MKISDILDISNGSLVNFPFISSVEGISTQAKKIKRGDLFFALDQKEIEYAISKGAYAIIFDKPTQVSDYEIAWIKVDCVKTAISKFVRYELAHNPKKIYLINDIEYEIVQNIASYKNINILSKDNLENYHKILNSDNIFVCNDKDYLEFISSKYSNIDHIDIDEFKILSNSTFDITFNFNNRLYERVKIPKIFASDLFRVIKLLMAEDIDFSLHDINLSHFYPLYIDNFFNEKEYGKSEKVLIFEPNIELVQQEIDYLAKQNSWAKSIVVVSSSNHTISYDDIFIAKNNKNIIDVLKKHQFNFALIVGKDKNAIEKYLNKTNLEQLTLFDI